MISTLPDWECQVCGEDIDAEFPQCYFCGQGFITDTDKKEDEVVKEMEKEDEKAWIFDELDKRFKHLKNLLETATKRNEEKWQISGTYYGQSITSTINTIAALRAHLENKSHV